jgi:hypothetical protein
VEKVNDSVSWLYAVSVKNQCTFYLGKIEDNQYVPPCNFSKLEWHLQKGAERLWRLEITGDDIWSPITTRRKICYHSDMPAFPEKTERNKDIVLKRLSEPKVWSYAKLADHFSLDKKTVEQIFKRDVQKYATRKEITKYLVIAPRLSYRNLTMTCG